MCFSLLFYGIIHGWHNLFLFQGEITKLGHAKKELKEELEQLKDQLDQQREYKKEQERKVGRCTTSTLSNSK